MALPDVELPEDLNTIIVYLTFDCPHHCDFCMNKLSPAFRPEGGILPGAAWISGLNRLRGKAPLVFNGGEPLVHPDFYEIMEGLSQDLRIDLLTTLPFNVEKFAARVVPKRFARDLPYASIRVTFHPDCMELQETISKVRYLAERGFDIEANLINHPAHRAATHEFEKQITAAGLRCVVKPFFGMYEGIFHGLYKYPHACTSGALDPVMCKTTNVYIGPDGTIYRCYADLLRHEKKGAIGNILDSALTIRPHYSACNNFGACHPCDVQVKYDANKIWGFTVADIQGDGIETVDVSTCSTDWGFTSA